MQKKSEQEILSVLNGFYRKYDDVELKSRTDILYEMEKRYPDWNRNQEHAAKIKEAISKQLPIDVFFEERSKIFDEVFNGWTAKQISEFAKKYDSVLNQHKLMVDNINYRNPIANYAHRKTESKMREASQMLKDKLGDSLGFTGFDKEVSLFGGKKMVYNDLKALWQEQNERK